MKSHTISGFAVLPLFIFGLLLTGCNDTQKLIDRMNLTEDEISLAKPIIAEYVKKTDKVFEELQKHRPSGPGGPGGAGGPPPQNGGFSGSERPDMSKMNPDMDKKKAEIDAKFTLIDAQTIAELQNFLSNDKIEEFKLIAAEYREEKMRSSMKGKGPSGPPPGQ